MAQVTGFLDWLTWKRMIIIAAAGALIVGGAKFAFVPLQYAASTTILLSQPTESTDGSQLLSTIGLPATGGTALTRMEQVLKSRLVRNSLIEKHKLTDRLPASEEEANKWLSDHTSVSIEGQRGLQGGVGLRVEVACPATSRAQKWLGRKTAFTDDEARELCAKLANEYIATLDEYMTTSRVKSARDTAAFIEGRLAQVQADLDSIEGRLEELQSENVLLDPQAKAVELSAIVREVALESGKATREVEDFEHQLTTCRARLSKESADRVAQEVVARNPTVVSLEERRAVLLVERSAQVADGKTDNHPDVVAIDGKLNEIDENLATIAHDVFEKSTREPNPIHDGLLRSLADIETRLAGARAREAELQRQLADAEQIVQELPPVAREYAVISRERQIQTEVLTTLARQLEIARIDEQRVTSGSYQVLDEAAPPRIASGSSTVMITGVAFIALLALLALGWFSRHSMFAEYSDEQ